MDFTPLSVASGCSPIRSSYWPDACEEMGYLAQTNLGQVDDSGNLDTSFKASTEQAIYQGRIYSLALQTNGQILLGGLFTNLCGALRNHLGRA